MGSLDSSIRSAARATSSAYKRLPIRWRLAGGSAALTLVILCGFAVIVGVLTTRQIHEDFHRQVETSADRLQKDARLELRYTNDGNAVVRPIAGHARPRRPSTPLRTRRSASSPTDDSSATARRTRPDFGPPLARTAEIAGWRVETREIPVAELRAVVAAVRAPDLRGAGHRQPREGLPRLRRARRRPARAAGRPGHGAARDGADHRAHGGRAPDRAHARPVREDPARRGRGRGRRAGAHAGGDARLPRRGARRDRGRAGAPARVRRRRLARAAHAADVASSPTSSCSRRS